MKFLVLALFLLAGPAYAACPTQPADPINSPGRTVSFCIELDPGQDPDESTTCRVSLDGTTVVQKTLTAVDYGFIQGPFAVVGFGTTAATLTCSNASGVGGVANATYTFPAAGPPGTGVLLP